MSSPTPLGVSLQASVERLRSLQPASHITDPEPDGHVASLDEWADGQWARVIPRRFRGADLGKVRALHGDETGDTLEMWVACVEARPNVVLYGPVGSGKSYAAVAAVRRLHWLGHTVAYWPVTTLLEATSPGGADPAGALASAVDAEVLILDDLGAERDTEWVAERVYEVVNQRWLDEVPTIVTTNAKDGPALEAAVGPRVYSRLADGAVGLRLTGADQRRQP